MNDPSNSDGQTRLDLQLVARGHFETRSRARDAIARGTVRVDGEIATKAGMLVSPSSAVQVDDPAKTYVSRAALKLVAGLDHFGLDPAGRQALDVGASTGGFTEVLLERGAAHVTAIDVGHGQIRESLAQDPRVTSIEGLNARFLAREHIGERAIRCVVSDVSFISLTLALPPALALAEPGAFAVLLVKPQFEAGRDGIGKGGLLADPAEADRIAERMNGWLDGLPGWNALGWVASPIEGGHGNREFLIAGLKT